MSETLSPDQIEKLHQSLLELQVSLKSQNEESKDWRQTVALDQQSVGRLSRMDAMQQQQMANAEARRREQELLRVNAALMRMDYADEYGYCLSCGEDIPFKRLEIDPAAHLCVGCAS